MLAALAARAVQIRFKTTPLTSHAGNIIASSSHRVTWHPTATPQAVRGHLGIPLPSHWHPTHPQPPTATPGAKGGSLRSGIRALGGSAGLRRRISHSPKPRRHDDGGVKQQLWRQCLRLCAQVAVIVTTYVTPSAASATPSASSGNKNTSLGIHQSPTTAPQ